MRRLIGRGLAGACLAVMVSSSWSAADAAASSLSPPTPKPAALRRRPRLTEREAWAVLTAVNGLGPVGFGALLRAYGSGGAILDVHRGTGLDILALEEFVLRK